MSYADLSTLDAYASASENINLVWDEYAEAYSDVEVDIAGSGFMSETLTADGHGITSVGGGPPAGGDGVVGFYDPVTGTDFGSCTIQLNGGSQSCTTGLIPLANDFDVSTGLTAEVLVVSSGESGTVNYWGTLTPGPLKIYDSNKQLVETIDLAQLAVPEPSCYLLIGTALGLMWIKARGCKRHRPRRSSS
jgi:hypothetical protein